jgi:hypothetical protein
MRATNAKMAFFVAFVWRDMCVQSDRSRARSQWCFAVLAQRLDRSRPDLHREWAMTTASARIPAPALLGLAGACAAFILVVISILPS